MLRVPRSIYWQLAALVVAVALMFALSRFFPVVDFIQALQQRVMSLGAWAAICYPLLFAVCNVLLLPGGILAVGGGFFFGLWWGFLIVFVGNIVGTAISFALSQSIARRWFQQKLSSNPTLRALGPAVERESWKIILLSQLHPLFPTSLLNYFYAGLFLYVYVGTLGQLAVRIMRGENYPRTIEYWIWGGVFVTTMLLLMVLGRIAYRIIQTSQATAASADERQGDGIQRGIVPR